MFVLLLAILGLFTGSFLNVCIDRLPRGESIVFPPSHCESCQHRLTFLDLFPVFSFLFLRGRCRYCGAKIPVRIPLVELINGTLFAIFYLQFGFTLELLIFMVYGSILVIIFFVDLENQLILNKVTYPAMVLALIIAFFRPEIAAEGSLGAEPMFGAVSGVIGAPAAQAVLALAGGLLGLLVYAIPYFVYPGGMGMGDLKLAALVGLMAGYPLIILAVLLAWIGGGVVAAVLLGLKIRSRTEAIPAGIFMSVAALVTLLWGQDILAWYLNLFSF